MHRVTNITNKNATNVAQKQIQTKSKKTTKMSYSFSQINRDFLINIEERRDGKRVSRKLVGVSGLINAIGEELADKFINRAYAAVNADVCVCKLRRGMKVSFYCH